ncbi:MAG TPA: DUF1800 domain-containing protein [Gemmatimonadaceae bacterium]|nr:DUF1800 domain-containing protein [Gemmatimonadaceae bacterium]
MTRLRAQCLLGGFTAAVLLSGTAAAQAHHRPNPAPHPPPAAMRELTADEQVKHALNRLTFGPRPGDVAAVTAMGVDAWIARQLHPESIPDSLADRILGTFDSQRRSVRDLMDSMPSRDEFVRASRRAHGVSDTAQFTLPADDSLRYVLIYRRADQLANEILPAKLLRAELSERQLLEVMVQFWENHFYLFSGRLPSRYSLLEYERDVIRPHALGRFRDLLGAVAKSRDMLFYLDNWQSSADGDHISLTEFESQQGNASHRLAKRKRPSGLNENYARELLELHTMGVNGGYTQADVVNVARAFTGWTVQDPARGNEFDFLPERHDADPKLVLGTALPAGRGIEDGEQVLDILARHPSTATFISTKLVRQFVSDSAPPALVARTAETYRRTDGDIRECLRTIFTSPEFFSRAAYRHKVKPPLELVLSLRRVVSAFPDTTLRTSQVIAHLGEPLFGRVSPDGYPTDAAAWLNTGAVLNRINLGITAIGGAVPGASIERWPLAVGLLGQPLDVQVDGVIASILEGEASADTRHILIAGENPLVPSPQGGMATPAPAPGGRPSLPMLVGLALGAPEFQWR